MLILAREKEKASLGFYEEVSKLSFLTEGVKSLLDELKGVELGHVRIIEEKLAELES